MKKGQYAPLLPFPARSCFTLVTLHPCGTNCSDLDHKIQAFALYQSALIAVYCVHCSGTGSSGKMACTGQAGSHAPQSMQTSGSMYSIVSSANPASSLRGWMQSTGQTSTHAVSFVFTHGSAITYVIGVGSLDVRTAAAF